MLCDEAVRLLLTCVMSCPFAIQRSVTAQGGEQARPSQGRGTPTCVEHRPNEAIILTEEAVNALRHHRRSAAAIGAIEGIRQHDADGTITVISGGSQGLLRADHLLVTGEVDDAHMSTVPTSSTPATTSSPAGVP